MDPDWGVEERQRAAKRRCLCACVCVCVCCLLCVCVCVYQRITKTQKPKQKRIRKQIFENEFQFGTDIGVDDIMMSQDPPRARGSSAEGFEAQAHRRREAGGGARGGRRRRANPCRVEGQGPHHLGRQCQRGCSRAGGGADSQRCYCTVRS